MNLRQLCRKYPNLSNVHEIVAQIQAQADDYPRKYTDEVGDLDIDKLAQVAHSVFGEELDVLKDCAECAIEQLLVFEGG